MFERHTVPERLEALRSGPTVNPLPATTPKVNEAELGIDPNCVYAYLGNAVQAFGDTVLSLPLDGVVGLVSPFDTGGLVSHIAPVKTWDSDRRRRFLQQYSWPSNQIENLLALYPSQEPASVAAYLDRSRPAHPGPHALWAAPDDLQADVWSDPSNDAFRAWLWEARSPSQIAINGNIIAWTCSGPVYDEILRLSAEATVPEELAFFELLLSRYVPGGLSGLLAFLRSQEEAA